MKKTLINIKNDRHTRMGSELWEMEQEKAREKRYQEIHPVVRMMKKEK